MLIKVHKADFKEETMNKTIKLMSLTVVTMLTLVGCGQRGPEQSKTTPIQDEVVIESMIERAGETMQTYFAVDVNDGLERTFDTIKAEVLVDEEALTYEHTSNIVQATLVEKPQEGDMYSYGVVFSPDNQEITGAIAGTYSTARKKDFTDEVLEQTARTYIEEKQLVENPESLVFKQVDDSVKKQNFLIVVFENGENDLLIGISNQTGEVMYFEKLTLPEIVE